MGYFQVHLEFTYSDFFRKIMVAVIIFFQMHNTILQSVN